jgi:hypothetical protein
MTTNGPGEDNGISTAAAPLPNNTPTRSTNILSGETVLIILIVSVSAIVFLITVLVCYSITKRCRNSGNRHRKLEPSKKCELYQNSAIRRDRMAGDSLETIVNRPLPHLPDINGQSPAIPAIPEDDYVPPIKVDSHWLRRMQEIRQLPPAPPVFPGHLERLPLDGEGAYTPVIPDDEAPLLSPGPMREITLDQQLGELNEESGYVVPRSPTQTFLQQNVTDHSPGPKEIKYRGNEYKVVARAVVTPNGEEKQRPSTSKRRSLSESASVSSATQNETEKSKDTEGKKYLSTCQLYLSPPTQHRRLPVPSSKPTVVVCIHAEL